MGIFNIIINSSNEEETLIQDVFQGDQFTDDEIPIVVHVYSDSSDTDLDSSDTDLDLTNEETEELLLPSETQSNIENPQTNIVKKIKNNSSKNLSKLGKKKARRSENARQLDLMADEYSNDIDINDFMPYDYTFRFSKILEDSNLTNKILNPMIDEDDDDFISVKTNHPNKKQKLSSTKSEKITANDAFNNLTASQKTLFKRRNLPMGMVYYLDTCVFSFFQSNPTGTFVSEPLSSFERLMLHSIAHYYELNSYSFSIEDRNERLTRVTNNFNYFNPPYLCLSQYLEKEIDDKNNHFVKRNAISKSRML